MPIRVYSHPGLFDVFSAPYEKQFRRQQAPKSAKSKAEAAGV